LGSIGPNFSSSSTFLIRGFTSFETTYGWAKVSDRKSGDISFYLLRPPPITLDSVLIWISDWLVEGRHWPYRRLGSIVASGNFSVEKFLPTVMDWFSDVKVWFSDVKALFSTVTLVFWVATDWVMIEDSLSTKSECLTSY
jgi:hypothetical protein